MRDFLRRRLLAVVVVLVVLGLLSANRLATFLTEWWWFRAVRADQVFTGVIGARLLLGAVATAGLAVMIGISLLVARRLRPLVVPSTPQQAIIETYRAKADPYLPWLILAVALVFGISSGVAAATQWEPFLLWRNGGSFGVTDPTFMRDVGFYVFDLPFLQFVQGWLFTSLVLVLLLTAGAHLLLGGIRPDAPRDKVVPAVKAHLSVLLALVLAARGWGYWLDRYELNFSPRGTVTGAAYTDINAELPALYLLLAVTAVAVVLTLVNLRRRGFLLPGAAIGLLVLASILLQGVYPAAVQALQVDPQELRREQDYIAENQQATRAAYGIGDTELRPFSVTNDLDRPQLDENSQTIDNIRLWDPDVLQTTYAQLQALRTYYAFADVDVDRYLIDDQVRQVMLSARELDQTALPDDAKTWQNLALTYTHGLGVVASQVNAADAKGQPRFLAGGIPSAGQEELIPATQGVYYGETRTPDYSIVNTSQPELDYEDPDTSEQQTTTYDGTGGVLLGNRLSRLAFALRFSDPNMVLSGLPNDESRVLFHREIRERVKLVAPYLQLDHDPYPVVLDDRIVWVLDGYTTSDNYPYSERRDFGRSSEAVRVNYIRNSVKATVDAYNGTVTLYRVDQEDPVAEAWSRAFPDLYADIADAPEGLVEHFRYPEDLFTLQADLYRTYHIPGAAAFYNRADAWDVPFDAAAVANDDSLATSPPNMDPYYLLMRLPGESEEEFVLIQPYLALGKPNMIAWLAARSDPEHYGELFAVRFPSGQSILGPQQAQAQIEQEDQISQYITLRDQQGSEVTRGNLLVIPIEQSILYVEPLYLESSQARIPQLEQVVLVQGEKVVMESTLDRALAALLGEDVSGVDEPDDGEPGDVGDATEEELVQRAIEAFDAADQALSDGDLAEYQRQVERAREAIRRLGDLRGVVVPQDQPTVAPSDQPTGSESPTPTETGTAAGG